MNEMVKCTIDGGAQRHLSVVRERSSRMAPLTAEAVSKIDVAEIDNDEAVEIAYNLDEALNRAQRQFDEMVAPMRELNRQVREKIKTAIANSGGSALPHAQFIVRVKGESKRGRRIDVLRELFDVLSPDELKGALYLDQPEPEWKANLTKLDALARTYGGKVKEIVERGSPRESNGATVLIVEPKAIGEAG